MKNKPYLPRIASWTFAGLVFLSVVPNAWSATLHVDTTAQCDLSPCDGDDGKEGCSFGEAITAVDLRTDIGDCVNEGPDGYGINDTIHLPEGETLDFAFADHSDTGPTGLPIIYRSVTIHGHGATLERGAVNIGDDVFINNNLRFFEITSGMDPDQNESNFIFEGSEVLVFWDDTSFVGGNPGCGSQDIFKKIPMDYVPSRGGRALAYDGYCHVGGAGYVSGSGIYVSFDRTTFKNNEVNLNEWYASPLGGALFIDGGAFGMANVTRSVFTGNKAPAGGAIYAGAGVQMAISESTFADNEAQVLDFEDQPRKGYTADGKMGGAVFMEGPALTVSGSSFFRNRAGIAGAIALRGHTASMTNTTFFENVADFFGGAVAAVPVPYNYRDLHGPDIPSTYSGFSQYAVSAFSRFGTSPSANLQHVTAVGNAAGPGPETLPAVSAGGGVANLGAGVVSLKSLILTGNTVAAGGSGPDCYGAFVSYGTNDANWPVADGTCVLAIAPGAPGDISADPVLKPCNPDTALAGAASCDPDTTSPLLEAALACPSEDQHHTARVPEKCTVGAIEVKKPVTTVSEGVTCGNGQLDSGEECDDGEARNSNEPDAACRTDCTRRTCGDGVVDTSSGEECEPSEDPLNCRSDCTVDLCFMVKADALRVGSGDMKLSEYLAKYGINPSTGCSAKPEVNQCQPLSSLGGPGSDHADFTVNNEACLTTADSGGCSLIR